MNENGLLDLHILLHIVIVRMTGTFLRKPAGGSG